MRVKGHPRSLKVLPFITCDALRKRGTVVGRCRSVRLSVTLVYHVETSKGVKLVLILVALSFYYYFIFIIKNIYIA